MRHFHPEVTATDDLTDLDDGDEPDPICHVCHNCVPRLEQVYYMGSDGEAFYYDRRICQSDNTDETGQSTGQEARIDAMRTVHSSNVCRRTLPTDGQPRRDPRLQATLAAEIEINGIKALALFDSGSTTDSVTPEFAFVTRAKQVKLDEQVILQLGCVGSRSKISYGTTVPINICGVTNDVYFDLVNIDRYDCIIGTPFMNTYGVCLDFGNRTIRMNGQEIKSLSLDEEQSFVDKKKSQRSGRGPLPPHRETAPIRRRIVPASAVPESM